MDWNQLISLKPVICQLLKSNNCWFWGEPFIRIEAGIQTVLRPKSVWTRSVFNPDSNRFSQENSLKTVWKQFENSSNQLCMSIHVKIDDLKTVTDLKTVIFLKTVMNPDNWSFRGTSYPDSVWKQLWIENNYADRKQLFVSYWIRITADFGDQLSGSDQIRITT